MTTPFDPVSLFYPGRIVVVALLEDRLQEASRQIVYRTRQCGRYSDDTAWNALDAVLRAHSETVDRLQHIHDNPDIYPLESRRVDLTA